MLTADSARLFEDYDDAAGNSRTRKAITKEIFTVELPRGIRQCKDSETPFPAPVCRLRIGSFHPLPRVAVLLRPGSTNCSRMGGFLTWLMRTALTNIRRKNAIIRELINQVPYDKIANNYGLTFSSVQRYATQKLRMSAQRLSLRVVTTVKPYSQDRRHHSLRAENVRCLQRLAAGSRGPQPVQPDPRAYEHAGDLQRSQQDGQEVRIAEEGQPAGLLRAMREDEEIIKVEQGGGSPQPGAADRPRLNKQLETLAKIAGVVQEVTNVDVNINMNTHLASNVIQIIQREVDDPAVVQRIVEGLTHDA